MAAKNGWPVWYELMTPDPSGVASFYHAVLGWKIDPQGGAMPGGSEYRMIGRADGGNAGGVLTLSPGMQQMGAKPAWMTYFYVADVDASAAQLTELGGTVHMGPMDLPGAGRVAMVSDPFGATFYIMRPTPPEDQPDAQSDVFAEGIPGRCAWNELGTTDGPGAREFYGKLFGWTTDDFMPMGPAGEYRLIELAGTQIGAISPMVSDGVHHGWVPYFRAEDAYAAHDAVLANGGSTLLDFQEVPGDDVIFIAADPSGAQLAITGRKKES